MSYRDDNDNIFSEDELEEIKGIYEEDKKGISGNKTYSRDKVNRKLKEPFRDRASRESEDSFRNRADSGAEDSFRDRANRRAEDPLRKKNKNIGSQDTGFARRSRNIVTTIVALIFVAIFAVMSIYLIYFDNKISPTLEGSAYNPRTTTVPEGPPVRRGTIYASNGEVIAKTVLDDNGKEVRSYPYGKYFAVPVGSLSSGTNAIEGAFSNILMTATNERKVKTKASDIKETEYYGDNITTTLDPKLQKAAYDALGDYKGAVVAIQPSTGKVLAMVSKPTFNPSTFNANYSKLSKRKDGVLLNRATQSTYTPGSTFKIYTLLEYIREHPQDYPEFTYTCTGSVQPPGGTLVNCQNKKAHGKENLKQAFVYSCNCAFSTIGTELNLDNYKALLESIGVNSKLDFDIATKESTFTLNSKSPLSEVQTTSFGQGETLLSPLQNLLMTSAIANNGVLMKPYLVEKVTSGDTLVKNYSPVVKNANVASPEEVSIVKDYMKAMVKESLGSVFYRSYSVAGKTGTAEYSNTQKDKAHMWFTCFSPVENPEIAVIAICEETSIDYTKATTVCRKVLDAYYGY